MVSYHRLSLFALALLILQTVQPSSTRIWHDIIPVPKQTGPECGVHALFNAYCFATETDHYDLEAFQVFRIRLLALHGPIQIDGIFTDDLWKMRTHLVPEDTDALCITLLEDTSVPNDFYPHAHNFLQVLRWFYTGPAPKKLSIIFLYGAHFNTFNFYRDYSETVTVEVADSSLVGWRVYQQCQIIKEMVLQGRYLATHPAKPTPKKPNSTKPRKRRQWVKIAHFCSLASAKALVNCRLKLHYICMTLIACKRLSILPAKAVPARQISTLASCHTMQLQAHRSHRASY